MQEEYGDQIQVLFVESQGSSEQAIIDKQLMYKWLGGRSAWTTERPFSTPGRGLPSFALLDADGRVVLSGSSNAMHTQIKETVAEMIKSSKKAPADVPKPVGKALVDIRKGDYVKANAVLSKLIEKPSGPDPAAMKTAAESAQGQLMTRAEGEMKQVKWLAENGYPLEAMDLHKSLAKRAKGLPGLQQQLADLGDLLMSDDLKPEVAAAKELAKLEQKFFADYKGNFQKKFLKMVEKHGATKVAERASFWAKYAR